MSYNVLSEIKLNTECASYNSIEDLDIISKSTINKSEDKSVDLILINPIIPLVNLLEIIKKEFPDENSIPSRNAILRAVTYFTVENESLFGSMATDEEYKSFIRRYGNDNFKQAVELLFKAFVDEDGRPYKHFYPFGVSKIVPELSTNTPRNNSLTSLNNGLTYIIRNSGSIPKSWVLTQSSNDKIRHYLINYDWEKKLFMLDVKDKVSQNALILNVVADLINMQKVPTMQKVESRNNSYCNLDINGN
jgi:hypothetical protein